MSDEVYRSVRMSPLEVDSLLKQLDSNARRDAADGGPRRAHARLEFRINDVLIAIKHPGEESVSKCLVSTRNLSAGGLSFMYGGFLHSGTLCSIVLTDTQGELVKLLGVVRSCRHVSKTLHEIGVQFTKKVDPARFVRTDARMTSNDPGMLDTKLPDLQGRALFVSEIECERSAAKARLSATGLEIDLVARVAEAIELAGTKSFDLVFFDSALGDSTGQDGATQLREAGFLGSVVCVVDDNEAPALAACEAISAIVPISAPVGQMMGIVAAVLTEAADPANAGAIFSVFGKDRTRRSAIERFVMSAGALSKELDEARAGGKLERLKELCATLRSQGWEHGFPAFGDATRRVFSSMASGGEGPALAAEVDRLSGLCLRLRAGVEMQVKVEEKSKEKAKDGAPGPSPAPAESEQGAEGAGDVAQAA